jgi:hypothetical protein
MSNISRGPSIVVQNVIPATPVALVGGSWMETSLGKSSMTLFLQTNYKQQD